jgi:putative transposase
MEKSLAHTKYLCKYHFVIVPKYRRKIIYGEYRQEIGKIIRQLCEWKGIKILEAGACVDHIHMCLSFPPKYSISYIMGYLKGKSALMLFDKFPELRKKVKQRNLWTKGYFVSTVGLDEAKVRKYIREQEVNDKHMDKE